MVRPVLHYRQGYVHLSAFSSLALVAELTGNIRYGFLFLVFMLWAALPVLSGVDVERGRTDAREWSSSGNGDDHEVEEDTVS
jgi:MFS-type transporter involved in bile tolerance (Atg22 family)